MDGLEPHHEYLELLERVPPVLEWAMLEEREDGYDVWLRSDTPGEGFLHAGFLDAERLRLGVTRVISGITLVADPVLVFRLRASRPEELDAPLLDLLAQAALFGATRFTA